MKKIDKYNSYVLSQYRSKDVAKAMEYLDTDGYFSYDECFDDGYEEGTLRAIKITGAKIEDEYFFYNDDVAYPYFIPKNEVVFEPEEKEYVPYKTIDDLPFKVGDTIKLSYNPVGAIYYKTVVTEISHSENDDIFSITLGSGLSFSPKELLGKFAIFIDNQWQPMGVEENDIKENN